MRKETYICARHCAHVNAHVHGILAYTRKIVQHTATQRNTVQYTATCKCAYLWYSTIYILVHMTYGVATIGLFSKTAL